MGRCKQLLPINGEATITYCLGRIMAAGLTDIVVVLGHYRREIEAALGDLPMRTVVNPAEESEMADSVRLGLAALPRQVSGVMVALCDHPLVRPETYRQLQRLHDMNPEEILIPVHQGRGGHPTLFPRPLLQQVEETGRPLNRLLADHADLVWRVEVDDPGIVHDMDYQADYLRLLELAGPRAGEQPNGAFE